MNIFAMATKAQITALPDDYCRPSSVFARSGNVLVVTNPKRSALAWNNTDKAWEPIKIVGN